MTPTCTGCVHEDKSSEDEPCNRCAVVDGPGSRYPVRWAAKPAPTVPLPDLDRAAYERRSTLRAPVFVPCHCGLMVGNCTCKSQP